MGQDQDLGYLVPGSVTGLLHYLGKSLLLSAAVSLVTNQVHRLSALRGNDSIAPHPRTAPSTLGPVLLQR